ncbi:MAG: hypothetical protein HOQ24_04015 [Mycobacteriaceae bacterium]|nr:hypothetical protein [Mycobacteriaceae bacterium]
MTGGEDLTTAARIDRLFATFHARSEPAQSAHEVAETMSAVLGRPVDAAAVTRLRAGEDPGDAAALAALARHFGVPASYLTDSGPEVARLHRTLELLAEVRDAGVRRLALRGTPEPDDAILDTVLGILAEVDAADAKRSAS